MPPRIPSIHCPSCRHSKQARLFTSTATAHAPPRTNPLSLLHPKAPPPPAYPYGRSYFYKQANSGLYGGASIQFGNNVSERTETKTRRSWLPNVVMKSIFSRTLGRAVRLKVSTRVLRTIDKVGGLDEYLLGPTAGRVKELGVKGWQLRWAVLNHPSMKKKIQADSKLRELLGGGYALAMEVPKRAVAGLKQTAGSPPNASSRGLKELNVAETYGRTLREYDHMAEKQVPTTLWQRVRRAVTRPFSRG